MYQYVCVKNDRPHMELFMNMLYQFSAKITTALAVFVIKNNRHGHKSIRQYLLGTELIH